ncbi:MAG: condensation domain-containing protein, partial [Cyclobacteriaceae bacterium]
MRIEEFIGQLEKKNISISVEKEQVRIRGNRELLTKEIINEIKYRKNEILEFHGRFSHETGYEPIPLVKGKEYFALSSAQKQLYFLHEFDKTSSAYNMPHVMQLKGNLEFNKLENVLERLIQHHSSLRT